MENLDNIEKSNSSDISYMVLGLGALSVALGIFIPLLALIPYIVTIKFVFEKRKKFEILFISCIGILLLIDLIWFFTLINSNMQV